MWTVSDMPYAPPVPHPLGLNSAASCGCGERFHTSLGLPCLVRILPHLRFFALPGFSNAWYGMAERALSGPGSPEVQEINIHGNPGLGTGAGGGREAENSGTPPACML